MTMNPPDPDQQEIDILKANKNYAGLGQKLQQLMKLPQSLCKTRGDCCRIATFKGSLSYEDLKNLAESADEENAANAREFLTLFEPYASQDEVRAIAPVFVERVLAGTSDEAEKQRTAFFRCRFVGQDGRCQIHEDRPTGCRVYPFPHEKTIYHPGCGFEQRGMENWRKVQDIIKFFDEQLNQLNTELDEIEET